MNENEERVEENSTPAGDLVHETADDSEKGAALKSVILTLMVIVFLVLLTVYWIYPMLEKTDHAPSKVVDPEYRAGEIL